jgi:hypothetical protein
MVGVSKKKYARPEHQEDTNRSDPELKILSFFTGVGGELLAARDVGAKV